MPFPTTPLLDDFNRPNEALSASANWGTDWWNYGVGGLNVISNQCGNVIVAAATSDWIAATYTDTEVYMELPAGRAGDVGLIARIVNPRTASASGYVCVFASVSNVVRIERWDNQIPTVLTTGTQAISAGDSIGFEVIGSTITVYHKTSAGAWSAILSTTDATYAGPGGIGIAMTENTTRAENFSGGEVVAAGISIPVVMHNMRQQGMS